ncbi:ABC-type glycerol-3-phosphate transport system substrate-binding protein [Deinobacterium chartae]|uniref:ABC-type glycerol-3-phosphate transport system substrate-binding protein n=1 Tax=Deinobacterium chartae TaxID=521158 RepID=A0A841I0K1_9DEIO|nr:extracellular solute-binding protein [Deinobacterium chartae]MBB6097505.1 ABC-type glycerol-3-phosphate transport system substrate-binding protein [Deinobacterium chartae]
MKRMLPLLALSAGLLVTPALAQDSGLRGNISVWVYPLIPDEKEHRALWNDLVSGFNKQYPNLRVSVDIQPWAGRNEKLAAAVAAGRAPDLVYLIPDQIPQFVRLNALQPITLNAKDRADYFKGAIDGVTYQGKMYTAPILMSAYATVYNKKLFEQAGVTTYPKTWADVAKIAPKFKEKGLYLTSYSGALEETLNGTFYPFLWQAGGSVFAKDGKSVAFNSAAGVRALTFIVDLFKNGYADPSTATRMVTGSDTPLARQKAAASFALDSGTTRQLIDIWGSDDNLVIGLPLRGSKQVTYGTVGGFAMPTKRGDSAAAKAFLDYLIQPATLKKINLGAGYFPPRKSVGKLHDNDPVLSRLEDSVQYAIPGEVHPLSRQVMSVLAPELQAAILGKKTPKQALDDAARAANDLIRREGL